MTRTFRTTELRINRQQIRARQEQRRLQNDYTCAYLLGALTEDGEHTFEPQADAYARAKNLLERS